MDQWIDKYRSEGEKILEEGGVRELSFAGPTYQVEVFDGGESFWPFLQFDKKGGVKDAFCSCDYEERCPHLVAAYLKIFGQKQEPIHLRFFDSLWNILFTLCAEHFGYDTAALSKKGEGHFAASNKIEFSIHAKSEQTRAYLTALIEKKEIETPENSIKFSDLPSEEIEWWREGRASPSLLYTLSFWSDLAKWALVLQERGSYKISFKEGVEKFPTELTVAWEDLEIHFVYGKAELLKIIPALDFVDSPLSVSQESLGSVEKISFDSKRHCFEIQHKKKVIEKTGEKRELNGWIYRPNDGFYAKKGGGFFDRDTIPKKEVSQALSEYHRQFGSAFPINLAPSPLNYSMHFDEQWNWHFEAYLFEPGDLSSNNGALFENWAYLEKRGFFAIENVFFEKIVAHVSCEDVSTFVNHHRIWLNGQEEFQTHLASIESHLSYHVDTNLIFQSKTPDLDEANLSKDFGEWIYYKGQGFFTKGQARAGQLIRAGLEIEKERVSTFIKLNRDELEMLPRFFTENMPLTERGLEVTIDEDSSIKVEPIYNSSVEGLKFFGDFVYVPQMGFCELPPGMRLPDAYQRGVHITEDEVHDFLSHDFHSLEKHILKIDPRLKIPHKTDLQLNYLVRSKGGLKTKMILVTEFGTVALTELFEAAQKKGQFCFSQGGLIDLRDERFAWLLTMNVSYDKELQTIEMSTLDFLRLDATVGLLSDPDETAQAQVTNRLFQELREFTVAESPNIQGLKSELRLYQQTGLQWLWFLYRNGLSALLCDDMGLGKTHQAMALMAAILANKIEGERCFLVVCPTSVIYHWQDKLEMYLPDIKVHTFHGLKRSLKKLPKEGLILTTYGIVRMEKEALRKIPFDLAIYDEIQLAKNSHSQVHKALTTVNAVMRLGLTGTPIENSLSELKALMDIVLPGYMPSETRFRSEFITPIEVRQDAEKKALLAQIIRPFIMRRRKSEVLQELPEKCENKSYCDLSDEQAKIYRSTLKKDRASLISELQGSNTSVPYIHIFSLLSRLKQVCNHPALITKDPENYANYESGKWDLFIELLSEARESDQKVVVFSQYLHMLDIIEAYLKDQGWGYAQIRGSTVDRRAELKRFQEDPNCVVFIGSLQAAGLGIDLTAASVVILYDRWWNAARENQAIDRVHRIGQKWGVQVFKLISKGTIEEKIDLMITRKGQLMEEIVTADDQAVLKKFTRAELLDLLSYDSTESL